MLSVDLIAQAALDDGIATFSMPSVAARLGVAHSGLYRYVSDREELVVHALERAVLGAEWPSTDLPWVELLRAYGDTCWRVCETYPGYDSAALSAPYWSDAVVELVAGYADALRAQGFSRADAAIAIDFISTLVLTSSVEAARHDRMVAARAAGKAPVSTNRLWEPDDDWQHRGRYDSRLEVVLDGLANRVDS
jgi:AcrR family transcriptional regulator